MWNKSLCPLELKGWSYVLTDCGQNGGGVVEGPSKLPLLPRLVRDALQHHRLQQLIVLLLNAVILLDLLLDLCETKK